MKHKLPKRKRISNKSLITRIAIYSAISLLSIVSFGLAPKRIFDEQFLYETAVKYADIDQPNDLVMHHYDVFAKEARFNKALVDDVNKYKAKFINKHDVMVVKIKGENSVTRYKDYIFITNQDIPPLNIEYHIARNLTIKDYSLPIATFLISGGDITNKVNNYIYTPLLVIIHLAFLLPFGINDGLYIHELVTRRKLTEEEDMKKCD